MPWPAERSPQLARCGPTLRLLDRLGIAERVEQDQFPGLALLDATDVDSIELGHRAQVEALLPRIDAVIWVLDPDKYADPLLHEEFIRPLADSADQFLFVLNQVDRLAVGSSDRSPIRPTSSSSSSTRWTVWR